MSEKVSVAVCKRRFNVGIEGLKPSEIRGLAKAVDGRMEDVRSNNPEVADSSKLAILAAMEFAGDLTRLDRALAAAKSAAGRDNEEFSRVIQACRALPKTRARLITGRCIWCDAFARVG